MSHKMIEPALDALIPKVDSKYTLVVAAARRARKITAGEEPAIETDARKPVTIALEELDQGKLFYEHARLTGK